MSTDHSLTRGALLLFQLELLDEAQSTVVRRHLEECAPCREALATTSLLAWGEDDAPGHIPASVLARWDRSSRELRGLERAFVRAHLADCPDCRQDLELVGKSPVLAVVPELELSEDLATHLADLVETLQPVPPVERVSQAVPPAYSIRVVQGTTRRGTVRDRLYLGWALAASVAAAVLAFGGPASRAPGPAVRVATRDSVAAPARDARIALDIVTPPRALPSPTPKGTRVPVTNIEIHPGEDLMQLTLQDLPAGNNIDIEVFSADGQRLGSQRVEARHLESGDILRMRALGELAPGSYLLRLRGSATGDTATLGSVDYPISLRHLESADSTGP